MRSLQGCQWRGTKREEPRQFSNFEYFTTHNYGFCGGKMDKSGAGWVHVCVLVSSRRLSTQCQHQVCLIITPQSFLASLSFLGRSSTHLLCSSAEGSEPNKAHSHAERMWGPAERFPPQPQSHTHSFSITILSFPPAKCPRWIIFFGFFLNVS